MTSPLSFIGQVASHASGRTVSKLNARCAKPIPPNLQSLRNCCSGRSFAFEFLSECHYSGARFSSQSSGSCGIVSELFQRVMMYLQGSVVP